MDHTYLDIVEYVLTAGTLRLNRTGTDTLSCFGLTDRYDLNEGFPLLTTKQVSWRNVLIETLWYLRGDTTTDWLHKHGVHIWDPWAAPNGSLGPVYGKQWREWGSTDQIRQVYDTLRTNPFDRRMVVSAWNVDDLSAMALPPCHAFMVFNVQCTPCSLGPGSTGPLANYCNTLNLHLTQRSCDIAIGLPYNIASYALLLTLMAHLTGMRPGTFSHTLVDAHIYTNHVDGLRVQLTRTPRTPPQLTISPKITSLTTLDRLLHDDSVTTDQWLEWFQLTDYDPHPSIKFEVAV